MSIIRIARADEIRPAHAAMIFLACAVLAGSSLLTNGPKVDAPPEGLAWSPNSWLASVVGLMNLEYTQTTANGIEIKSLILGVGAAMALVIVGLGLTVPPTTAERIETGDVVVADPEASTETKPTMASAFQAQLPPLLAAQLLMLLYVAWSFFSMNWAVSSSIAFGGSALLLTYTLWSLALGHGLNQRSAQMVAVMMVAILTLTATMAIWYHAERNPMLRVGFPIGNPLFLAACLLPGIVLAIGWAAGFVWGRGKSNSTASTGARPTYPEGRPAHPETRFSRSGNRPVEIIYALIAVAAMLVMCWAFQLTGGRGPQVGLVTGLALLLMLVMPKNVRWWVGIAFVAIAVFLALKYYNQATQVSATGRDATIRTRLFAWDYGVDLIVQKPFLGHGQGGYTLLADALAVSKGNAEQDPIALNARIANAHNEWLQVLADLGPVGFVLLLGSFIMTFVAAWRAMRSTADLIRRVTIAALLAGLIGIIVSEAVGVGLRVAGVPAIFYSVLGLLWAMSGDQSTVGVVALRSRPMFRGIGAAACGLFALGVGVVNYNDYQSARDGYEAGNALAATEWDKAVRLAESGATGRLDPQRRLHGILQAASVHLYVAEYHLNGFRSRMEEAHKGSPPDQRLIDDATGYARTAEAHQRAGMNQLMLLNSWSPLYWSSGEIEAGMRMVRAQLLAAGGDPDGARQESAAAGNALERDIQRRPFELGLVLRLIDMAGPAIPPEAVITVASRPLRASLLVPEYTQMLLALADVKQIREPLEALVARMSGQPAATDETTKAENALPPAVENPSSWSSPWMPEIYRWAAIIRFRDGDYVTAQEMLKAAGQMYEQLSIPAPLAAAHAVAELANAQFFETPDDPGNALETARMAIQLAPQSEDGRHLIRTVDEVSLRYQIAACQPESEQAVRQYIQSMAPQAGKEDLDYHLGNLYTSLALSFTQRQESDLPGNYGCWAERASELTPESNMAWRLMADAALQRGDDAACVQHLRKSLDLGADPKLVIAFVQLAISKRPESEPLKSLHQELLEKHQPETERPESAASADEDRPAAEPAEETPPREPSGAPPPS